MMRRQPALLSFLALATALSAPAGFAQGNQGAETWKLGDALNAPDWLEITGSVRPRYETLANTLVAGRTGGDELLSVQTLLKAELNTGPIIAGVEFLDSRRFGGNAGGGAPGEIDTLEPAQFYLAWRPKDFLQEGASLDLTLGRFTMDIGSRRLIARANYRSVLQSFDGARAIWTSKDDLKATAFYTHPTSRLPSDAPSALDNEVTLNDSLDNVSLGGFNIEAPLPFSLVGELYLFDFSEDDASDNATRNRDLSTLGARLRMAPAKSKFDFDLEYAGQTGSVRATTSPADTIDLDHDADMLHAQIGYTFDAPWSPRLALQYDQASGDRSSADQSSQRFDTLFGDRAFEFGPTSIYGVIARTNLIGPGVRFEVKPHAASDALLSIRRLQLDSDTDSLANSGVRDATGASGDYVGTQVEVRYRRWLIPDSLRLSMGGAAVIRGDFLESAPNATSEGDTLFGYTDLTWTF
ncbi:MAG: alginate export family protein [Hyphomonadaceae bacterium]|nr:alginate export family protein [Hyphomonadaceae bacterium]